LAEALKTNTTLTWLWLENSEITAVGAKELAEALKTNTTKQGCRVNVRLDFFVSSDEERSCCSSQSIF
jgi:hypothetical protein